MQFADYHYCICNIHSNRNDQCGNFDKVSLWLVNSNTFQYKQKMDQYKYSLLDLPTEILLKIFSFLNYRTLCKCAQVCEPFFCFVLPTLFDYTHNYQTCQVASRLKPIANDNFLWKKQYEQNYSLPPFSLRCSATDIQARPDVVWKELFKYRTACPAWVERAIVKRTHLCGHRNRILCLQSANSVIAR